MDELFDYVPSLDKDTDVCEEGTVPEIQQWQCSEHEQYSPIINTLPYGNAVPSMSTHSSTSTQTLLPAIDSHDQACMHMPSPPLQLEPVTECTDKETPHPNMANCSCAMSPERAIALKRMYIDLLRELHQLVASGALSAAEYRIQKEVILGHMLVL